MAALTALALVSLLAWTWLAVARGGFWRADQRLEPVSAPPVSAWPGRWPAVVAVIPARNEAATIGRTVGSLLSQAYPGPLAVVVVDDGSSDGTADRARSAALAAGAAERFRCVAAPPPLEGWVGKVAAMHTGVAAARTSDPDAPFLLFTDADIEHDSDNVARLVARAIEGDFVLVSLMVRLHCRSAVERLLIPPFVFFFQKLFPFRWVADPGRATAAAAGGCMLVRRTALEAAGGLESIRDRLIDDCALAARLKAKGPIWLGLSDSTVSLRPYRGLGDIWSMVARTAFAQLNHSLPALLATIVGMLVLYAVPPASALAGLAAGSAAAAAAGLAGWLLITALAAPTFRLYQGRAGWSGIGWAMLTPLAAMLYTAMTVDSARRHWLGRGGAWKGRTYGERPTMRGARR